MYFSSSNSTFITKYKFVQHWFVFFLDIWTCICPRKPVVNWPKRKITALEEQMWVTKYSGSMPPIYLIQTAVKISHLSHLLNICMYPLKKNTKNKYMCFSTSENVQLYLVSFISFLSWLSIYPWKTSISLCTQWKLWGLKIVGHIYAININPLSYLIK